MFSAVFLDRDGTIIRDVGYLSRPSDVDLLPGSLEALCEMSDAGLPLVLVSNQSGIGRGLISEEQAGLVHRRLEDLLAEADVCFAAAYYCPHHPKDRCRCRKPGPGLLEKASVDLNIDLITSAMVGDRVSDAQAGERSGCRAILIDPMRTAHPSAWRTVPDLASAAEIVVRGRQ